MFPHDPFSLFRPFSFCQSFRGPAISAGPGTINAHSKLYRHEIDDHLVQATPSFQRIRHMRPAVAKTLRLG